MVSDRSNGIYRSVIVAFIGWLILAGNTQPVSDNARGNAASAQGNESAAKDSNVASGISRIGSALEAQNAKTDPYEKERNEREIRDLDAQENSAYWAGAMFWATAVAVILSVIGVGLVYITFRATRKSNEIAHDHQRARLLPSAELTRVNHLSDNMQVVLRCENIGLSPAYRVRCFALPVGDIPKLPPNDAIEGHERTVKVGDKEDLVVIGNFEKDDYVIGFIQYDTIFSGPKFSYFCFGFNWSLQSRRWFATSQVPKTWPRDT